MRFFTFPLFTLNSLRWKGISCVCVCLFFLFISKVNSQVPGSDPISIFFFLQFVHCSFYKREWKKNVQQMKKF